MTNLFPLILVLSGPALAGDVYRWVDRAGNTHYGEVVPEQYKSRSRRVDTSAEPTSEQRREAQERALRDREAARRMAEETARNVQANPPVAVNKPTTQASSPNGTPCEREWRRFAESNECFAPYMIAGGGIKAEAFQKCVEVKVPNCGPPPAHPARER